MIAEYLDKEKYNLQVDGMDLSSEMLDVAQNRKYYTNLYQKNVYLINKNVEQKYDFAISSGMFTHSHVKPEAIENILNLLTQFGNFIFTVRNSFCREQKFEDYINCLLREKKIRNYIKIDNISYIDEEHCTIFVIYN